MADKFRYGGQAVMEGVMMRGAKTIATVVRKPDGTLAKDVHPLHPIYTGRWRKLPFTRGVIAMIEAMVLGTESLIFSTNVALEDLDEPKAGESKGEKTKTGETKAIESKTGETKKEGAGLGGAALWLVLLVSLAFAVGLFSLLPLFLTNLILPGQRGSLPFNILEGVIRLGIFLLYLWGVGFMPDIRRVFSYHGAEHKTIHAYEAGEELTPANVQKYSTAHARCGTAFLLAVLIIAIFVFSLVGKQALWLLILSRILLLPVIAAIAYEVTQYGARHMDNIFVKWLVAPGLWLQSLTTKQPDDSMVEVAIASLKEVLMADGVMAPELEVVPQGPQA
jgi:hypothetical protein